MSLQIVSRLPGPGTPRFITLWQEDRDGIRYYTTKVARYVAIRFTNLPLTKYVTLRIIGSENKRIWAFSCTTNQIVGT